MSDPKYEHIGSPIIKVIEECGEVIQAACKGDRFGWYNWHPDRPEKTNLEALIDEAHDLAKAIKNLHLSILENTSNNSGEGVVE